MEIFPKPRRARSDWRGACAFLLSAVVVLAAVPLRADVVVETFDDRMLDGSGRVIGGPFAGIGERPTGGDDAPTGVVASLGRKLHRPTSEVWFIPFFSVDTTRSADTTLWAARNGGDSVAHARVVYYTTTGEMQRLDAFLLDPHAVKTVNIRDVPALEVDADGMARGAVGIQPDEGVLSVDYMQVDVSGNLAVGREAYIGGCRNWEARFLSFGPGQGSVLTMNVEPLGASPDDPPSVLGDVYDEEGTLVNSFVIRTDEFAFQVAIEGLVEGDVSFGSVELVLAGRPGLLVVDHTAENRFSVGFSAVCADETAP